jgi:ABC-type uncharacterized transport system involved in gliding motility auxiliary subunit
MSWLADRVGHSASHTLLLALQVLLGAALFASVLVLAERHNVRFDLTPTKSFLLSDEATQVVQAIHEPMRVTVFYNSQDSGQRRRMEDILELFAQASPNFSYRLADLDRSPALAKKYDISSFNTGVLEIGDKRRDLGSIDQQSVTDALLRLTRKTELTLCFITSHGEHSPRDSNERSGYNEIGKALEKEGFDIRTLDLVPQGEQADACTAVILAGPVKEFLPGELEQLGHYLENGGNVLLMIDPDAPSDVVDFLARYGVRAGNDVVVDERNRIYGADSFMPRVPIFDKGTFGNALDTAAVFSVARTVSALEDTPDDLAVLLLALTSQDSWAHIDGNVAVENEDVHFRREIDEPGPLPVAVMVTSRSAVAPKADMPKSSFGHMIVIGDSDFVSNLYLNLLGNKDFFMSSVGVLAKERELIAMRTKGVPRSSLSPIFLTASQGRVIFWAAVVVEPGFLLLLGTFMTWRRRRKASR